MPVQEDVHMHIKCVYFLFVYIIWVSFLFELLYVILDTSMHASVLGCSVCICAFTILWGIKHGRALAVSACTS